MGRGSGQTLDAHGCFVAPELPIRTPRRLMELVRPSRHSDSPPDTRVGGLRLRVSAGLRPASPTRVQLCAGRPAGADDTGCRPRMPHPAIAPATGTVDLVSAVDAAPTDPAPRDPDYRCSPWTQAQ